MWRGQTETNGRTRFDWPVIKEINKKIIQNNPDMGKNEIIAEVQLEFQNLFHKEPPSRTSLQNNIKTWR